MTANRRLFMKNMGGAALATLAIPNFLKPEKLSMITQSIRARDIASMGGDPTDEDFWATVRQAYSVSSEIINLNNGGVSPQAIHTAEQQYRYTQMCNEGPAYFMWQILDQGREPLREKLSQLTGTSSDELAINRNSSEGLVTSIMGIPLKAGDEVIIANLDYPHMVAAWRQREKRDGIKLVSLTLEVPQENDDYFVNLYKAAVTSKTKVVHITHILHYMGQILPVRKIADAVKAANPTIVVISDSAHSFAHIDYKIPDLNCDYWAASLHKWLCAPFGTGLLYVKKERIAETWPLLTSDDPTSSDIRKFENLGTRSFPAEQAIGDAIDFHNAIGIKRKEARLRYLKNYWVERVKDYPKVKIHISLLPQYSCALGSFSIDGIKVGDISTELATKHKITNTPIDYNDYQKNVQVIRVTPNVYTSLADLDKLVDAIKHIADNPPSADVKK